MEKRKVKSLSILDKLRMLKEVDEGCKQKKQIASEFGIPATTLSTILKNRATLTQNVESIRSFAPGKKRFGKCVFEDVDKSVLKWVLDVQGGDAPWVQLTDKFVREKAKHVAQSLGRSDFRASSGWLDRFKSRHNILYKYKRRVRASWATCGQRGAPSSLLSESITDQGGSTKPDCVAAEECVGVKCEEIDDNVCINIKAESPMENLECRTENGVSVIGDEVQKAFEIIRGCLQSVANVPDSVNNALSAVENFLNSEYPVSIKREPI